MKKVLLVNPWIEDVSAYDYWLKPLGLLYISSALKASGVETVMVDCLDRYDAAFLARGGNSREKYYGTGKFFEEILPKPACLKSVPRNFRRFGFPESLLRDILRDVGRVDGVLVTSMMTYWHYGVRDTIRVIKEEILGVPVILGGVYATLLAQHARETSGADLVCPGTGLKPLATALKHLGIRPTLPENWFESLDPDYTHYVNLPYAVIVASLGCPFRCTYCASGTLWSHFKSRDPQRTADLIERLSSREELKDIVFFDDAILLGDFKTLLREIIHRKIEKRFHLPNGVHARLLDEETADLLYEANFKTIKLGLETSDPSMQKITGGKVTNDDFLRAICNLQSSGFSHKEMSAYILINLPGQTEEDISRSLDICEELGVSPSLNEFTPIPGTAQWSKLVETGLLDESSDPLLFDNSLLPYWWNDGMKLVQIQKLKERAWSIRRQQNAK